MPVLIGTSGWQYRQWKANFYPTTVPQRAWLEFYAERFDTVEVNNAFYRLPDAATFAAWAARTPPGFVVALKASRYLTHIKRLRGGREPVDRLMERCVRLGDKLGPILLQLPPNLKADLPALVDTLDAFPRDVRVAVEFRHDTWYADDVRAALAERNVALCYADRQGSLTPLWRTASWGYLRFHEGRATPRPCYGRTALQTWADQLAARYAPSDDVFVYFNNDTNVCALRDAVWFAAACERAELVPSRVPTVRDVQLIRR